MAACYNYSCVLPIVLLAAAAGVILPLSQAQQNYDTITLFEAVANEPNLSMVVTLIEAGGLMYGNPLGNVTVFAPNNQAFNGANDFFTQLCVSGTNLNAIVAHGNNKAASILLYHIVSSPYVASELLDAADAHMLLLTELSGYNLTVSTSTGSIEIIGGASSGTVVQSNVKVCDSAVVHIIDAVLLPSSPLSTIPSQPSHNEPDIGAGLDPAISSTLLLGLVATAATSVLLL